MCDSCTIEKKRDDTSKVTPSEVTWTASFFYYLPFALPLARYFMSRTDWIQSVRLNSVSPSCPYLGMMPWRLSEARAPSCRPWPLYLAKMWPCERTQVIMVNLVSRCFRHVDAANGLIRPKNYLSHKFYVGIILAYRRKIFSRSVFWEGGFGPCSLYLGFVSVHVKI